MRDVHRKFSQFGWYFFGHDVITINGFSMGAWATGVNAGEAMRRNGIVKSTGPDLEKILRTLEFFGPRYPYVITGYPPFLKHLVDESEKRGFDWQRYRIYGVAGGEGMSEGLRAYLERRFITVYSGYGASDIDIGVAGEMPITVWIRKRVAENPALQRALFGDDPRLPMLFQYNPLDYYIETNDAERTDYHRQPPEGALAAHPLQHPRRGRRHPLRPDARRAARVRPRPAAGVQPGRSSPSSRCRSSTSSGAATARSPTWARTSTRRTSSRGSSRRARTPGGSARSASNCSISASGEQRACVHVEVLDGITDDAAFADRLRERVLDRLLATNLDFRSSVEEDPSAREIIVRLHAEGQGPFAMNSGRIKRRYIVPSAGATTPELAAGRA